MSGGSQRLARHNLTSLLCRILVPGHTQFVGFLCREHIEILIAIQIDHRDPGYMRISAYK